MAQRDVIGMSTTTTTVRAPSATLPSLDPVKVVELVVALAEKTRRIEELTQVLQKFEATTQTLQEQLQACQSELALRTKDLDTRLPQIVEYGETMQKKALKYKQLVRKMTEDKKETSELTAKQVQMLAQENVSLRQQLETDSVKWIETVRGLEEALVQQRHLASLPPPPHPPLSQKANLSAAMHSLSHNVSSGATSHFDHSRRNCRDQATQVDVAGRTIAVCQTDLVVHSAAATQTTSSHFTIEFKETATSSSPSSAFEEEDSSLRETYQNHAHLPKGKRAPTRERKDEDEEEEKEQQQQQDRAGLVTTDRDEEGDDTPPQQQRHRPLSNSATKKKHRHESNSTTSQDATHYNTTASSSGRMMKMKSTGHTSSYDNVTSRPLPPSSSSYRRRDDRSKATSNHHYAADGCQGQCVHAASEHHLLEPSMMRYSMLRTADESLMNTILDEGEVLHRRHIEKQIRIHDKLLSAVAALQKEASGSPAVVSQHSHVRIPF